MGKNAPNVKSGDIVSFYGYYNYEFLFWDYFQKCTFISPAGIYTINDDTSSYDNELPATKVTYDMIAGYYEAGPSSDEYFFPFLSIDIDGSTLCISLGSYRGSEGCFDVEFTPESNWPKIENNSITFSAEEIYWDETYNLILEFVPASKISGNVETIYLKGSQRFNDYSFTRVTDSPADTPSAPPAPINSKPISVRGEYDDIAGTYIDEYGNGFYMFIGYEDSSKQVAYLDLELVAEMIQVKLLDRSGNSISGHNLYLYPQATSPTQIVDLEYNPYDGSITATISAVTQEDTIRFIPCPDAPYLNPYYVD